MSDCIVRLEHVYKSYPLGDTTVSTYEAFTFGTTARAATNGEAAARFTRRTL